MKVLFCANDAEFDLTDGLTKICIGISKDFAYRFLDLAYGFKDGQISYKDLHIEKQGKILTARYNGHVESIEQNGNFLLHE